MKIRMIAFDLDGTLLDDRKNVSEKNRNALEACANLGIYLVPCTGRISQAIPDDVLSIQGIRYAVTINGAAIEDLKEHQILEQKFLSYKTAVSIMKLTDKHPRIMYDAYLDGIGISEEKFYDHLDNFGIPLHIQDMVRKTRIKVPNIIDYIQEKKQPLDKINLYFADLEERAGLRKLLKQFSDILVSSSVYNNLEINGQGADKGAAILRLAEYLGITREEIMAFGDGENDYSMIQQAGVGVAMNNGENDLKAIADYVTRENNDSGVAYAIEKMILGIV